jgi:hypothetical protein
MRSAGFYTVWQDGFFKFVITICRWRVIPPVQTSLNTFFALDSQMKIHCKRCDTGFEPIHCQPNNFTLSGLSQGTPAEHQR